MEQEREGDSDYEGIPLGERVFIGSGHRGARDRPTQYVSDMIEEHGDYINFADLPSRAARRSTGRPLHYHSGYRSHDRRKSSVRYGTFSAKLRRRHRLGENITDEAVDMYEDVGEEDQLVAAEYVRQMDIPLHEKRVVLRRITSRNTETRGKVRGVSCWMGIKLSVVMKWKHFKNHLSDVKYSSELWKSSLKEIEGSFGSGVLTYFIFLRWLFLINIPIWLLLLLFLVTPQIIYRLNYTDAGYSNMPEFGASDFFTGLGWFNQTEMYYGIYTDTTFNILDTIDTITGNVNTTTTTPIPTTESSGIAGIDIEKLPYNMQYAYLFTSAACYLLYFIILALSVAESYARSHVADSDSRNNKIHNVYTNKVMCGWDYGITQARAAEQRHKSIKTDLEECLGSLRVNAEPSGCCDRCSDLFIQIFTNFLILASYVCLYFLLDFIYTRTRELYQDNWGILLLPLIISVINRFLPYLYGLLASKEKYRKPSTRLYITMTRTMMLKALTIGLLIVLSYKDSVCTSDTCDDNCWENVFGATIYQLILIDFIITFILTCTEFIRGGLCSLFKPLQKYAKTEFDISRNTLHLIYLQALSWVGAFFSPMLPFIVWMLLLALFYTRKLSLMYNYRCPIKPWRASHTHTVFLFFLGYAFLLSMCATGYAIISVEPSRSCGPYRGVESVYDATVITAINILEDQGQIIEVIIELIISPGSVIFFLALLCVGVYYFHTLAEGAREMEDKVKDQLVWEGRDKLYLMNLIHRRYSRRRKQQQHRNAAMAATASATAAAGTSDGTAASASPHIHTQAELHITNDDVPHGPTPSCGPTPSRGLTPSHGPTPSHGTPSATNESDVISNTNTEGNTSSVNPIYQAYSFNTNANQTPGQTAAQEPVYKQQVSADHRDKRHGKQQKNRAPARDRGKNKKMR